MIQTAAYTAWTGADAWAESWDRNRANFWILSVCQARKFFPNVILNTDAQGRDLLVRQLGLPFTEIHNGQDDTPKRLSFIYSIGKSYTIAMLASSGTPFLHLDDDFVIWEDTKLKTLLNEPATCQHWYPIQPQLRDFCTAHWGTRPVPAMSICSGAHGGNDTEHLNDMAEAAIQLALDPKIEAPIREAQKGPNPWLGPCMIEEAMFGSFFPPGKGFLPNTYKVSDQDWINGGISHSIGSIKRNPMVMARTDRYVRLGYPEYAARADALVFPPQK